MNCYSNSKAFYSILKNKVIESTEWYYGTGVT